MQGTRERVLGYIVLHREVRIEELVGELGITSAAVRRHLDNLRADGLVDVRPVKQPTGRPYYSYYATERATPPMPAAYADLLERMLRSVGEQDASVTAERRRSRSPRATARRWRRPPATTRNSSSSKSPIASNRMASSRAGTPPMTASTSSTTPAPTSRRRRSRSCPANRTARRSSSCIGLDVEQLNRIVDGAPAANTSSITGSGPNHNISSS